MPRVQPAQWHDPMVDMLIDERRRRNDDYHNLYGRSRQEFWASVARRINRHFYTSFTGEQCSQKWRNLIRDYNRFCLYRSGAPERPGRRLRTRTGARIYRLFRTRFWERRRTRDDRRRRRNRP